ncbi:dienelactone hydrolase family protein [Brevundimonas bullata]|uniref:dienelactone hydrolase family protein n=1 Tax=Brevundimonas bullata TaxID=13160 RepID=UPI003D9A861E
MSGATVLLLHGAGGLAADLPVFLEHGLRLAERGYRIVMPDYFSGARDAAQSDDLSWWPQAVVDATDWTLALPGVDVSRLGAMGYSRGGYLAAEVAVQQTPIRAVVGVASAGNVKPREIVRRPSVMLIHAAGDPVIPPHRTKRWARILSEQGVPVETVVLNVRRHHFRPGEWTDIFERADGFFRRTLIPEV